MEGGLRMGMLFWPLTLMSALVSMIGLYKNKGNYFVVSALLIAPMSIYLAATPKLEGWGLSLALLYVGAASALRKRRRLAMLFVLVNLGLIGWIARLAITS